MDEFRDDPIRHTAAGGALPRRGWALVRDGVVAVVVHTYDFARHPFEGVDGAPGADVHHSGGPVPLEGVAVLDVTGADAHSGMLVDEKGNVTPAEGRTTRLSAGEPAYHAGPNDPGAAASADGVAEPEADHELPPPDKPEGE